jgi:renalase
MAAAPVVVLGAGLAGLAAARQISAQGRAVVVVDKGRAPGGRLATRRIGRAVLDHGAQFFTVRSDELQCQTDEWLARGLVREWCRGFGSDPDGYPRYVATAGMAALARDLAAGLDVRTGATVEAVIPTTGCYTLTFAGGSAEPPEASAVIATPPVPQSLDVLAAGGVQPPDALADRLAGIRYHPVLALLVRVDGDPDLPRPGAVQQPDDPTFSFIADNRAKGLSAEPALTFHASHRLSEQWWERADEALRRDLLTAAAPWLGRSRAQEAQLKRWRYAGPVEPWPERAVLVADRTGPVILAGDAFGGPKVEGAYRSGLAAAALVDDQLVRP